MMRLEVNGLALTKIMRSAPVLRDLEQRAKRVAEAAGPGMEVDLYVGRRRARASVRTADEHAMRGEAKDRRLTRAFQAARG